MSKQTKKTREWLKFWGALGELAISEAEKPTQSHALDSYSTGVSEALAGAFVWGYSSQGYIFWEKNHRLISTIETLSEELGYILTSEEFCDIHTLVYSIGDPTDDEIRFSILYVIKAPIDLDVVMKGDITSPVVIDLINSLK